MAEVTRSMSSRLAASRRRAWEQSRARLRLAAKRIGSVLLLLALASPIHAITITFGDIEITPEAAPKGTSSHGYFEYVFHVVNKSEERSYVVSLSIPFEKLFLNGDSIRELRRTVQVGAKETVRVSLFQPDHPPMGGMDVAVTIDGRQQERGVPLKPNDSLRRYHSYRGGFAPPTAPIEPLILLGTGVKPLPTMDPVPGGDPSGMRGGLAMPPGMATPPRMPPAPGTKSSTSSPKRPAPVLITQVRPGEGLEMSLRGWLLPQLVLKGPACLGAVSRMVLAWQVGEIYLPGKPGLPPRGYQFVNAETWSIDWLAYTRYDGIIITAEELTALPEGVRTALWQYVETGGLLLVLGRADLRGLSALSETTKDNAGWLKVVAGFGTCRLTPDANYDAWNSEQFEQLLIAWTRSPASTWSGEQRNTVRANQDFPVVDDLGIPVKGLFLLMFLFTLGIGPINILVLTRLKRRIWFLWTTPVLSLFTCLAVFGYMLFSEGWSGQLRSETLTLLDETTHRATTIGWTGIYSPLTPSDGLHFSRETEVVPQRFYEGRDGGARSCTIDWSADQHFVSGWVEARVPALFRVRKSELRRERVTLKREQDGRWSMVNGLSKEIRRFWFADAKGQIHKAEDIAPGAKAMLTLTEMESLVAKTTVKELFLINSVSKIKELAERPQNYLRPGLYLAELDDSPFLEDALPNARKRKLHALVMGIPLTSPER